MSGVWYEAWASHHLPSGSWRGPMVRAVVRDEKQDVVAVFPYAIQTAGPLKFISLGGPYGPLRSVPLARERREEACASLVRFLTVQRDGVALRLGPVENTDPAVHALLAEFRSQGWHLCQTRDSLEFTLDLPETLAEYQALVGPGLTKKSAYYERRMGRQGQVQVRLHTELSSDEWERVMGDVEAIELASWVAQNGGLLRFSGKQNRVFWSSFLSDTTASSDAKVWLLYFNGKAVSHCFAIDSGQHRYIIANAYMQSVMSFSTGVILLRHVFEDALERRIRVVNYGEGDSGYKTRWGFVPERRIQEWFAFRPGLTGVALLAGLKLARLLSALPRRAAKRTVFSPRSTDRQADQ
jgi:hypothetical protein